MGFAGHEHLIQATSFSGRIVWYPDQPAASHVSVSVATGRLEVVTPPDTAEIRKVTAAMREDVLDVAHYPEITLVAPVVSRGGDTLHLQATLTIKGNTRGIPLSVRVDIGPDTLRASAERLRAAFEAQFWCEEESIYALALDGRKQRCRSPGSTVNGRLCHHQPERPPRPK